MPPLHRLQFLPSFGAPSFGCLTLMAFIVLSGMALAPARAQTDFKDFEALMRDAAAGRPASQSVTPRQPSPEIISSDELPRPPLRRSEGQHTDTPGPASLFFQFPELLTEPGETKTPIVPSSGSGQRSPNDTEGRFHPRQQHGNDSSPAATGESLDWRQQTTSIADLRFPASTVFQHGDAFLTLDEESAYMDLLDTITEQRQLLVRQTSDAGVRQTLESRGQIVSDQAAVSTKGIAVWQEAFYQFANARRLAWQNGHLRTRRVDDTIGGLPSPFGPSTINDAATISADAPYRLIDDIKRFPEDYVGRPIAMYGRYTAESVVRLGADEGVSDSFVAEQAKSRPEVRLMRGTLSALTSAEPLAIVDTKELLTPQSGPLQSGEWPGGGTSIPVLVKGWVVKKWDSRPLIYCESIRQISPIPHFQLIRRNTTDKSALRDEEKWLYYETLKQLQLTSSGVQREVAGSVLRQRIDELMGQISSKIDTDLSALDARFKTGGITEDQYRRQKVALRRSLNFRIARYRRCLNNPQEFQTFVDLFQNPDFWHGHLVTLRGHVRHVITYPGDEMLSNGQPLYEFRLFTDDSQHNPAVVVTTELPPDFPVDADVIDRVTVTGSFFKRYVYGSQDTNRIAPLLLSGNVHWQPTVDQVQALVAAGHLSGQSPRAQRAADLGRGMGDTAIVMVSVFVLLTFMILWGRAQREERDRVRLRRRVSEVPEFDNPLLPGYTLPASEFDRDYLPNSAGTVR